MPSVKSSSTTDDESTSIPEKAITFWTSTPLWSGIAMLLGMVLPHFSTLAVYVFVWILFIAEFMRVGFFKSKLSGFLGTVLWAATSFGMLVSIWKITPKEKEIPSLDRQANAVADNIFKRAPWLSSPPRVSETATPRRDNKSDSKPRPSPSAEPKVSRIPPPSIEPPSGNNKLIENAISSIGHCQSAMRSEDERSKAATQEVKDHDSRVEQRNLPEEVKKQQKISWSLWRMDRLHEEGVKIYREIYRDEFTSIRHQLAVEVPDKINSYTDYENPTWGSVFSICIELGDMANAYVTKLSTEGLITKEAKNEYERQILYGGQPPK